MRRAHEAKGIPARVLVQAIPLYAKWRLRDNARDIDVNALQHKMIGRMAGTAIAPVSGRLTLTYAAIRLARSALPLKSLRDLLLRRDEGHDSRTYSGKSAS
jgi:hypothetical protein